MYPCKMQDADDSSRLDTTVCLSAQAIWTPLEYRIFQRTVEPLRHESQAATALGNRQNGALRTKTPSVLSRSRHHECVCSMLCLIPIASSQVRSMCSGPSQGETQDLFDKDKAGELTTSMAWWTTWLKSTWIKVKQLYSQMLIQGGNDLQ